MIKQPGRSCLVGALLTLSALAAGSLLPVTPVRAATASDAAASPQEGRSVRQKGARKSAATKPGSRATKATTSARRGKATTAQAARGTGSRTARKGSASRRPVARVAPAPLIARPPAPPAPVQAAAAIAGQALVPIAAGGITSTSARMASELAVVLDSDRLRVLPMMTRSTLADALALAQTDKADLAFLHSDLLASLPEEERPQIGARIAYIARLYNEEVHVIAGREINGLRDLGGKKVNVGLPGSSNAQTAELIFDRLGVAPRYVYLDQPAALTQLAAGEIAADVLVSGRPVRALQEFSGEGRFKLLSVPFDPALQDIYLPAKIDAVDYGNLVPPGRSVETVAVGLVLATIDAPAGSPRAARVARFTQALFSRFEALREPTRHPKWRDVNLAASVAGWTRFPAAQDAIAATVAPPTESRSLFAPAPGLAQGGVFRPWSQSLQAPQPKDGSR